MVLLQVSEPQLLVPLYTTSRHRRHGATVATATLHCNHAATTIATVAPTVAMPATATATSPSEQKVKAW
jgi:hypothetical protein